MKYKAMINRSVALFIAWVIVLLGAGVFDAYFETWLRLNLTVWLWSGLIVLYLKKIPPPLPDANMPDVPGAFRMLWWALWWPFYLVRGY